MAVKIGGADGGSKYVKKNQFKLKDGDSTFRILPSLGLNGEEPNGRWAEFYRIHFGYKNSKGEMRVFHSPFNRNFKTKMVDSPDAALERIETLKAQLEKAKEAGNTAVAEKLMELVGSKKARYNLDSNWHMNVIDEQGNIGILKIRHKAKAALDAVIKTLRSKGIEPLGADSGRFFVFSRTGTGLDTMFTVTVKTRTLNVAGVGDVQQDIVHALTSDIVNRLESEAGDLGNLYKFPTSEEVAQIVATSDLMTGKSTFIDVLFDTRSNKGAPQVQEEDRGDEDGPAQSVQAATTTVNTPTPAAVTATVVSTPTPNAESTVTVQATQKAKVAEPATTDQSDDDFLKSLGL